MQPGDQFGDLTVVETGLMKHGTKAARCRCRCGNEAIINVSSLNGGATKSCGCLRKKVASETHRKK